MGEKSSFTFMVGEDQEGHTFTISGLQGIPEIEADIDVSTMEDLVDTVRMSGSETLQFTAKLSKKSMIKLRWYICKAFIKNVFSELAQIIKTMFRKEG